MLGIVGLLGWFLFGQAALQGGRDPPQLAVEQRDLAAQVGDVAARGQVDEVPQAPAARLHAAADARLGARGEPEHLGERRAARRLLEPGGNRLLGGVEDPPEQGSAV
jgi:hypothetical protein